jgi:hypothetical protein
MARATGLEPATSGVTGRHSNQLSYARADVNSNRTALVCVCYCQRGGVSRNFMLNRRENIT